MTTAAKPRRSGAEIRRAELAAIHLAAASLGMDTRDRDPNTEYRSMLWTCGRVTSAADLDWAGRQRLMDHLRARGAVFGKRAHKPRPAAAGYATPRAELIARLWADLAACGLVSDGSPTALQAWVKRQVGVDRVEWADAAQQARLVEALKAWRRRSPGATAGIPA